MFRLTLLVMMLSVSALFAAEATAINLPQSLEQAKQHLASGEIDSAVCIQLATTLRMGAERFPESSLVPEALQAAWKLGNFAGNNVVAVQAAEQLFKQTPLAPCADEAFDLVWNYLTNQGTDAANGAEFARESAEKLGQDPRSARFYIFAFQAYADAGRWKDAEAMGSIFLEHAKQPAGDPLVYLTMAQIALKSGNTKMSRQATETFIATYPKLPQQVNAQLQLGKLHEANGNHAAATASYQTAWNLYAKNSKQPAFATAEIAQAAAEALWTMQQDLRAAFDRAVVSQTPDQGFLNREADKLLKNYERCVHASNAYGVQAFTEMGQVCAALADLQAQRGLDKVHRAEEGVALRPLLIDAVSLNQKAIAYFHNAQVLASTQVCHDPDEARKLRAAAQFASERGYELTFAQGEWLSAVAFAATERINKGADLKLSTLERCDRWMNDVLPVYLEGFERKSDAVRTAIAANISVPANTALPDRDLRNSCQSMIGYCTDHWSRSASSVIQITSSIQVGFRNSGAGEMFASNHAQFEQSMQLAGQMLPKLTETLDKVRQRADTGIDVTLWEDLVSRAYTDYSSLCATVQNHANPLLEKLSDDYATPEGSLRKEVAKLAAEAAQEEYWTLVTWHKVASVQNFASAKSRGLLDRLAALDPQKYGSVTPDASASRQK